jgi:hypothetical protein
LRQQWRQMNPVQRHSVMPKPPSPPPHHNPR